MKKDSTGSDTLWLHPGDVILKQGEVSRDLYVLLSGELSVRNGDQEIARAVGYGEVVGELGALTGRPRTAAIVALTPAEVLQVRNVTPSSLERLPKVLAKIDAAITRRYYIVFNKNVMYRSTTATIRRTLLQEAMREHLESRRRPGAVDDADNTGLLRHQVRQRIDERLAVYADTDDPKILDRIAMDYGVQDLYRARIEVKPWLNDALVRRLGEIDNTWRLVADQQGAMPVLKKAECVVDATELLQEYEVMPGIRREMDIHRMEGIVPLRARIEALKNAFFGQHMVDVDSERNRVLLERKVKLAIDAAKADAGRDVVMLIQAARSLNVESIYESHIRNLVAMSETGTHFVDLSSAVVDSGPPQV